LDVAISQRCGLVGILNSTAIGNQSEVPRQQWRKLREIMRLRLELQRSLDQALLATGDAVDPVLKYCRIGSAHGWRTPEH
jgi:hypothetical protein